MTARPQRGFTLIEVLAALAIAATGLLAVSRTIGNSVDVADAAASRTLAYWVAANHLAELRIGGESPVIGRGTLQRSMGGRQWRLQREIARTADADVYKVEVAVLADDGDDVALARLGGYLARLEAIPPRSRTIPGALQ